MKSQFDKFVHRIRLTVDQSNEYSRYSELKQSCYGPHVEKRERGGIVLTAPSVLVTEKQGAHLVSPEHRIMHGSLTIIPC